MTDLIVRIEHVRAARINGAGTQCAPGIRAWFSQHSLSLPDFLQHGLPAGVLAATQCAYALRAIEIAQQMEADRGQ